MIQLLLFWIHLNCVHMSHTLWLWPLRYTKDFSTKLDQTRCLISGIVFHFLFSAQGEGGKRRRSSIAHLTELLKDWGIRDKDKLRSNTIDKGIEGEVGNRGMAVWQKGGVDKK